MESSAPNFVDLPMNTPTSVEFAKKQRLIGHILTCYSINQRHREQNGIQKLLDKALSAYAKLPDDAEKQMFARLGVKPDTYDSLTRWKIVSVIAVLNRVFGQPGQKAWSLEATPIPDVPEEVTNAALMRIMKDFVEMSVAQSEINGGALEIDVNAAFDYGVTRMDEIMREQIQWAKDRAKRMDLLVDDILFEDNFSNKTMRQFIVNLTKFGTGVIIGPCEEVVETLETKPTTTLGKTKYVNTLKSKLTFYTPSTLDCYPSPGALLAEEGDLCVKVRYDNAALSRFASKAKGSGRVKGWDADAVARVLRQYPFGGATIGEEIPSGLRKVAEGQPIDGDSKMIEGVRWFGKCPGEFLIECGIKKDFDNKDIVENQFYEIDAIVIGNELVCCRVCDPAIGRPVVKSTFYGDDANWFGWTLASQIENCQALMNLAVAGLKKQIQMSSGPAFVFNDVDSFVNANTQGYFTIAPWKTFLRKSNPFQTATAANSAPVMPITVPTTIHEILALFKAIGELTDDQSGFSRNMFGSGSFAGAARTARGLQRIQESANIVADFVIANIDATALNPLVRKIVRWINMRHPDESVKGDVDIVARGALGMALKSTQQEAIASAFQVANTGAAPQIIGPKGLMELLRQLLESFNLDNLDDIIPSKERMEFLELMQNIQQMQAAEQGQQGIQQAQLDAQGQQLDMAQQEQEMNQSSMEPMAPLGGVEERRGVA